MLHYAPGVFSSSALIAGVLGVSGVASMGHPDCLRAVRYRNRAVRRTPAHRNAARSSDE